jgi:hypothetical protein
VVALALAVITIPSLVSSHSFAATNTANVLKVSPVRSDVEVQAGTKKIVQVTVTNPTDAPISVRPVENDFVAGDERGTPALILDETKYAPTHSLKRFMSPLANVTVPAKQSRTIDVAVTIPKDALPGGYFGAVRFVPASVDDGGQVNLSASAASLILLTVPGPVVEKLDLTDFVIQQNGKTGDMFSSPNNLQISARFQNKGSVQVGPFGKVSVLKDDKVVYDTNFNDKDQRDMVLPDSARRFDVPLKNIDTFGHYTVKATFTYGKKNQTIEVTKSFWVIPQMLIIAAAVGVLVLIGLIVLVALLLRNRKRHSLRGRGFGRNS